MSNLNNSRTILENIIVNFDVKKFVHFFREKSRQFVAREENYSRYNDDDFKNGLKLGEINLTDGDSLIICAFEVKKELSERAGKKAQYDKAKNILKSTENQKYSAGIFIFYDLNSNFRFSLVYPESIGTRRQWNNFRRFTYFIGSDLTNKTFKQRIGDGDFGSLVKIKEAFSVEKVTKEFYESIAHWYFWAVEHCQFPKDAEAEESGRNIAVIRLITRIIFIWFMRERGLVPKDLFEENNIISILKSISAEDSTYYTAILQNLFFATLSTKKEERQFGSEKRFNKGWNEDFGNQYVFRYQELFKNPDEIKKYFCDIPFLNGGLFECLDDKRNGIIIDGFSRTKKNQPIVPNFLFFSQEKKADLNKACGTKNKTYKVCGLLDILSSFNFTIDENSPDDQDIALDPELLGRVFENLLASFNPETSTTARKATGSYYTPREIVGYMVTESLKAYFKTHLEGIENIDEKLENLFSTGNQENPFDKTQSKKLVELIESVKIVDPAVGSGAFPMGALNKLVFILNKIDPGNELWKQAQLKAADAIPDQNLKVKTKKEIEDYFQTKKPDYWRKLYLIQRCIYGVDIQQIAVEIAKLRFFISLLVDEDKDDIQPLPNLDFKIMQGNSLLEEYKGIKLFDEKLLSRTSKQETLDKIREIDLELKENDSRRLKFYEKNPHWMKHKKIEKPSELLMLENNKKVLDARKTLLIDEMKNFEKTNKQNELGLYEQSRASSLGDELKRLHKEFFETNEKETKDKIKKQIEKIEWDLIEATLRENGEEDELKNLEKFKKSKTRPFFLWKLNFPEVFEKGGFDIVIANPPYVEHKKLKALSGQLKKSFNIYSGTADLYVYFYEQGINILKNKGVLTYISSNKFIRTSYGEKLRGLLSSLLIRELVDFTKIQVFDALVASCVIIVLKDIPGDEVSVTDIDDTFIDQTSLDWYIEIHNRKVSLKNLNSGIWQLDDDKKLVIKEQIENDSKKLGEISGVHIYRGVTTGYNPAFVIDEDAKNKLIKTGKNNVEIIKPLLQGRNIKKWFYSKSNRYLLQTGFDKNIKSDFPHLYSYLLGYEKELKKRDDQGRNWWNLRACKYYADFEKEKIIWGLTADKWAFAYDANKYYLPSNGYILTSESKLLIKYILALLNSGLLKFYFGFIGIMTAGGAYTLKHETISALPIKEISETEQKPFIEIVDKILAITRSSDYLENTAKKEEVKEYERQIDKLVYELYGLSEEEIKIVENAESSK